jgi:hypothetical protein
MGLRHKQYCIFNQPYSKTEYCEKLKEFNIGSYSARRKVVDSFSRFVETKPRRATLQVNCENSSGNNLYNCRNFTGFNVVGGEDCRYYIIGTRPHNCQDILVGGEHQWCYEGVNPDHSYMSHFTIWCWSCRNVLYSDNCHSSEHLFGCIGLRRANYCILNQQYTPENYFDTVGKLIHRMEQPQSDGSSEWGEFFPISVSPFDYEETIAQDHFPKPHEEPRNSKLQEPNEFGPDTHLIPYEPPDQICDVPESITKEVLCCEICRHKYKIMPLELRFYRRMEIPIPHFCPDCRRQQRFAASGSFRLYQASCAGCGKCIESAEKKDKASLVYCQSCYERLIYASAS